MIFHLLQAYAREMAIANLVTYISVRTAAAGVTALLIAFVIGPSIIARLRDRKIGQIVRSEGPSTHLGKRGTPTMGGLVILVATVIPTLLWARLDNRFVLIALLSLLWMGAIGFIDDYLKIVQHQPRGLVAKYKLIGQVVFGIVLSYVLLRWPWQGTVLPATSTTVPFFKYVFVTMEWWLYAAFVTFVVTAFSNAVNLTDGLDGLATGLSGIAAIAFALFAYIFGRTDTSEYLKVFYLPGAGELAIFCAALMGGCIGFLWFNAYPAKVFMGDTGSLAIGGALGTVAILLKAEFLLVLVGGVFVAETVSVTLQTSVFKFRKRFKGLEYAQQHRVFRMAPLHHHFEKLGWHESTVVTRFYILGLLCALVALSTLKVR
ncbi:MAG: phospho-N-acetylmuramoyl-pentapeptide-transferase [Gemmatimonadetes bacterium GWC2_71_10]|nr:MAG: phospho-N-acetylmuramoyl-pentapeptide-transferase [Gemmatimonadetes bacterium GWC2_71_10]